MRGHVSAPIAVKLRCLFTFRRRERAMLRFRRMQSLPKFGAVDGQVHNHFNQERTPISRWNFAPRTFGSRIDVPPRWPRGVNSARPEQGWVGAISETILVCLTAPTRITGAPFNAYETEVSVAFATDTSRCGSREIPWWRKATNHLRKQEDQEPECRASPPKSC
jgi:hypothetical protein